MNKNLYIGLMSGTSADGIDLALVDFSNDKPKLLASFHQAYPQDIHNKITALYNPDTNEIERAFSVDIELAHLFAQAVNTFLQQQQLTAKDINAIGNHGQTIRHRPQQTHAFTLQIGCCQTLACLTNIKVIGQFRQKDIALGGQGAPLVPAFHQIVFSDAKHDAVVVNIGGVANISFLPATDNKNPMIGYDTGPGNALMDDWFALNQGEHGSKKRYDENGNWGAAGQVNATLLALFLADPYFKMSAPKSTGREYFHINWLAHHLALTKIKALNLNPADVQATLGALTAISIANEIKKLSCTAKIYLCGGGTHNTNLKNQLNQQLTNYEILLTNHKGIDADSVEAMAFAWLAFAYNKKIFSNSPAVTGAGKKTTLGCAFHP
ncbi:MAG: anhydro-N-acetylmuramic acid kinase [Gammaproteobacteria bacterium]|nr:MAG: anhydro-N-acetylmuramic acid kinase [Gammaproteobacteria bacterium]